MTRTFSLLAFAVCTLVAATASAQQPDPRDYEVGYFVPSNTVIANTYLRHQSTQDGTAAEQNIAAFRATYLLKFGDLVITPFDMIMPVVDATAHIGDPTGTLPLNYTARGSGLGDLLFLPTIGYGLTQDAQTATHTWFALTTYFTLPTGAYDQNRIVNIGRNRLAINPLLVAGQRFWKMFTFEVMGGFTWYADNSEVAVPGVDQDASLGQDISLSLMAHLAVDLHPSFYLGLSYYLTKNGDQTLKLSELDIPTPPEDSVTPGATLHAVRLNMGYRFSRSTLLLAQYNEEVAGTDGAPRSRFFGLRLSHVFSLFGQPAAAEGAKK